jgi:hypothetical protein
VSGERDTFDPVTGEKKRGKLPPVPDLISDQIRFRLESGQAPRDVVDLVSRAENLPRRQILRVVERESRRIERENERIDALPKVTRKRVEVPPGNLGIGIIAGFLGGILGVGVVYAITEGAQTRQGAWVGFVTQAVVASAYYIVRASA